MHIWFDASRPITAPSLLIVNEADSGLSDTVVNFSTISCIPSLASLLLLLSLLSFFEEVVWRPLDDPNDFDNSTFSMVLMSSAVLVSVLVLFELACSSLMYVSYLARNSSWLIPSSSSRISITSTCYDSIVITVKMITLTSNEFW